ncbi:PREDICTED: E3 ubiquitin-protein ligase LRSAM1-like isoform X2 [Priapulus caudatus]|uniref:E3 ubiquitin-protein ligase LRSAM1-like isoform X2 n=1 Tax=Priapulus caudatus TaxID=37621 RepID=A0ABM1DY10_PRICU|nr:PREDICTED: E3 ubiquitin-protein ligase LRSAM1-like isoform X2 [Priapulus caudatus]
MSELCSQSDLVMGTSVSRPPTSTSTSSSTSSTSSTTSKQILPTETVSDKESSRTDMPIFKKKKAKSKLDSQKLSHKLYLAQENPEPVFDVSGCGCNEVPSGIFSLCKCFRKESLLMYDNEISSLKAGGKLEDLFLIRVLDIHNNLLEQLPDEIGNMNALQVLNLQNNRLKYLPETIGKLQVLQTLNVKGNKLQSLPAALHQLQSLRTLDISNNMITRLHKSCCNLRSLEVVILDADNMEYPRPDVCKQGTDAIAQFLCLESGVEYIPPSHTLHPILSPALSPTSSTHSAEKCLHEVSAIEEQRVRDTLAAEQAMALSRMEQAQLITRSNHTKEKIINILSEEANKLQDDITLAHKKKDMERKTLVSSLYEVEKNATTLIKKLLEMNEQARKHEAILESLEEERMEVEKLFLVRQDEAATLRTAEILKEIERMLDSSSTFEQLRKVYAESQVDAARRAHLSLNKDDEHVSRQLQSKQLDKDEMLSQLLQQEEFQREAFEALQMQKDAKHTRLSNEIALVMNELEQMSMLEVKNQEMKLDSEKKILESNRTELTRLLKQLLDEKSAREKQLGQRLEEMEQRRVHDIKNYWLIQYQRLMDRKPQELIDTETRLEYAVREVLDMAGALEFIPFFANRITIETLYQMTDADLSRMGIRQAEVRTAILRAASDHRRAQAKSHEKAQALDDDAVKEPPHAASAPPASYLDLTGPSENAASKLPPGHVLPPTDDSGNIIARIHAECVVCMDQECMVLFLMCGHVCCCNDCAGSLKLCPMCRAVIEQRIQLTHV